MVIQIVLIFMVVGGFLSLVGSVLVAGNEGVKRVKEAVSEDTKYRREVARANALKAQRGGCELSKKPQLGSGLSTVRFHVGDDWNGDPQHYEAFESLHGAGSADRARGVNNSHELVHTCGQTSCVNPRHLELLPKAEAERKALQSLIGKYPFVPCGHRRTTENSTLHWYQGHLHLRDFIMGCEGCHAGRPIEQSLDRRRQSLLGRGLSLQLVCQVLTGGHPGEREWYISAEDYLRNAGPSKKIRCVVCRT
jgi:hypothetical protein